MNENVEPHGMHSSAVPNGRALNIDKYYELYRLSLDMASAGRSKAVNGDKESFIYVLSIDPNNRGEVLFPFSKNAEFSRSKNLYGIHEEPIAVPGESVVIPGNNRWLTADVIGEDHVIILYAKKPIDNITDVTENIKSASGANMSDRVKSALGSRMIDPSKIEYQIDGNLGIKVTQSGGGDVAVLILKAKVVE